MKRSALALLMLTFLTMLPAGAQDRGNGPNPFEAAPSVPQLEPQPLAGEPSARQTVPWRASPYRSKSGVAPLVMLPSPSGTLPEGVSSNRANDDNTSSTTGNPLPVKPAKTTAHEVDHALAKAVVNYAIIGFGVLIGLLIVFVLAKTPKRVRSKQTQP